jgi:hypothetical protein
MAHLKAIAPLVASLALVVEAVAAPEPTVQFDRNGSGASSSWKFSRVPSPVKNDAATGAKFTIVDGDRDNNGGSVERLNDGRVATSEDEPASNLFFRQGSDGGRLVVDLGKAITIKQVNSYSWHADTRGPQVYTLYGSTGSGDAFNAEPKRGTDPAEVGWKLLAKVDTRPKEADQFGGQYGVSVSNADAALGEFRYLLFDVRRTEERDSFGNTFYTEIDVLDANATATPEPANSGTITKTFTAGDGKYEIVIDTSIAPDLTEWTYKELVPVVQEWYPKLVAMLPSEGFEAPARITLGYRDNMSGTPASAGGSRVNLNAGWYRRNLKGEAKGAVVHELVHVVQQYGRARRTNPNATRSPGWLVEGIPDYIRWFLYEPETKGAEITRRNLERAKYDASYRISGNFLNWVTHKYDKDLVRKLNAELRAGNYREELWKTYTGKTVQELGDEWKKHHTDALAEKSNP